VFMRAVSMLAISALFSVSLAAQKVTEVQSKSIPIEIDKQVWILGSETREHWKGLLPQVNVPPVRTRAFPGQRLTIGVGARGKERDALLRSGTYSFAVEFGGVTKEFKDLRPVDIRGIKAEGSDFAMYLLGAAKVETKEVEGMLSMVSLALFDLDWAVPNDAKDGIAKITGGFHPTKGKAFPFVEGKVDVWSFDKAMKEGTFKDKKESDDWMMTYYQHPEPSRLLFALKFAKGDERASQPNIIAFYVEVLKSSPLAALDLQTRLKAEDPATRRFALLLLSEAGYDLTLFLHTLPEEERTAFKTLRDQAAPLPVRVQIIREQNAQIQQE